MKDITSSQIFRSSLLEKMISCFNLYYDNYVVSSRLKAIYFLIKKIGMKRTLNHVALIGIRFVSARLPNPKTNFAS